MNTKKAVMAVSMVSALLGLASQVQAGPVIQQLTLGSEGAFANTQISTKGSVDFQTTFSTLVLNGNTLVSGSLFTGEKMAVDVLEVFLFKLNATQGEVARYDFTETLAFDWTQPGQGAEQWSFGPQTLSAGTWALQVNGYVEGAKHGASFAGQLQSSNPVSEPESLALSLLALGAMAGLSRRQKKA
ncbi:FxDxF family PEP-CTERM protein [Roseateles sp.]|uniref:FxDxF family PEP-CTERM protein n=1 Tax=Roseateles sp. TaxID=1971397 RepID=UPI003BA464FC